MEQDMTEHPLYRTREEALAAPGEIYQHFKGGVYRLIERFKLIKKQ